MTSRGCRAIHAAAAMRSASGGKACVSLSEGGVGYKHAEDVESGIKDSSGDWSNTETLLREYPNFDVFPGSEIFLLQGLRAGSSGCITATGSVNPLGLRKVFDKWQTAEADDLQARASEIRKTIQNYPMIAAVKTMIAHFHEDPVWATVAPPLLPLDDDVASALLSDLSSIKFEMEKP